MFRNLSIIQKNLIAGLLAFVIVSGAFGSYLYISTDKLNKLKLPEPKPAVTSQVVEKGKKAIETIKKTIAEVNPEKLIFVEVTLEQLNIYPKNWEKTNFKKEQQENALISGPQGDPDNDGVINLKEFLYGSNPNSAYTFCGSKKPDCPYTDKEMLDNKKSPLTGLQLDVPKSFRLKRVDEKIVQGMQESFGSAIGQGLDFPRLYEQARTLNLTEEFKNIKVITVKDTRESMMGYYEKRIAVLKEFAQDDELSTFNNVYKLLEVAKVKEAQKQYKSMLESLNSIPIPETFVEFHRANLFIIDKLIKITDHRIEIISNNKFANPEEVEKGQKMAKEMFWGYRKLSEEQLKVQDKLNSVSNK